MDSNGAGTGIDRMRDGRNREQRMNREDIWNYRHCREHITSLPGRLGFPDSPCLEFLRLRLDLSSGTLTTLPDDTPVPGLHAAVNCILATYSHAIESPEVFRLVAFRELKGGPAYDATFRTRAILPLATLNYRDTDMFCRIMEALGGIPVAYADRAWKLNALPRVPVYILLWDGSDEFLSSAAMLFDASVPSYLETETAAMLGELVTRRIAFFCQRR